MRDQVCHSNNNTVRCSVYNESETCIQPKRFRPYVIFLGQQPYTLALYVLSTLVMPALDGCSIDWLVCCVDP
jgi:hypothetical protein